MKFVTSCILLLSFFVCSFAESDVRVILKRGTLRIAICAIETPPFFYDMQDGVYTRGIDVRLAEKLTSELGVKPVWLVKPTFAQVIKALLDDEADIAISNLSVTLTRATQVKFSTPYIELKMAALVNQARLEKNTVFGRGSLNKSGVRVGFVANSSYEDYARRLFPNADAVGFRTWEDVLDALDKNIIDVAFYDDSNILTTIKANPAISLKFKKIIFDEALDPIAIAVAPKKTELHVLMNQFVALRGYPIHLESAIDEFVASRYPNPPPKTETTRQLVSPVIFWISLCVAAVLWCVIIAMRKKAKHERLRNVLVHSLYNPAVIIMAMILGILYGAVFNKTGILIDSIGSVYLSMLKFCSVPIMVTAIIKSLGSMLNTGLGGRIIKRFVILLLLFLVIASTLGVVGGALGRPGALSADQKAAFGLQVQQSTSQVERPDLHQLLRNIVPSNLMQAVYEENTLGLLFVSIVMGIALAMIGIPADKKLQLFDTLFECFIQIINLSMYLLPFALFSLMAQQVTQSGIGFLGSMVKLIVVFHVLCICICIVMVLVLSRRLHMSPLEVLRSFKDALFVALGTSSSFAAMPCAMNSFKKRTSIEGNLIDMLLPMGVTMFRPGTILTLSLGTMFMAQLMGISVMSDWRYLIIIGGSVVAGLSAAGAPAASELSALAIFFPLLGIPFQVTMVILLGVNTLLDPVRTMTNILSNCALTALVNRKGTIEKSVVPLSVNA